jgi:hypothetical protein
VPASSLRIYRPRKLEHGGSSNGNVSWRGHDG